MRSQRLKNIEATLDNVATLINTWEKKGKEVSNQEWTRETIKALYMVGIIDYTVHAMGESGGEWLYDMCWLKHGNKIMTSIDRKPITRIVFAMECEWGGKGDVLNRFQKLCQSYAEIKLIVYKAENQKNSGEYTHMLKEQLKAYKQKSVGEKYLSSCYVMENGAFTHKTYDVNVKKPKKAWDF